MLGGIQRILSFVGPRAVPQPRLTLNRRPRQCRLGRLWPWKSRTRTRCETARAPPTRGRDPLSEVPSSCRRAGIGPGPPRQPQARPARARRRGRAVCHEFGSVTRSGAPAWISQKKTHGHEHLKLTRIKERAGAHCPGSTGLASRRPQRAAVGASGGVPREALETEQPPDAGTPSLGRS